MIATRSELPPPLPTGAEEVLRIAADNRWHAQRLREFARNMGMIAPDRLIAYADALEAQAARYEARVLQPVYH